MRPVRFLGGLAAAIAVFAGFLGCTSPASAQREPEQQCEVLSGETHSFEGYTDGPFGELAVDFDLPESGSTGTWELRYCLEMWGDDGSYMRISNEGQALSFVQSQGAAGSQYDDDYDALISGDPVQNPDLYPNATDSNFYQQGGALVDDRVQLWVGTTPFVPVYAFLTASWANVP